MKNQKYHLFHLIKCLSSTERGYIKKISSISGDENSYMKLFDYICSSETYDEEAIKVHFKDEKFIRQLSVAKNYLLKFILKSLRQYNSEKSKNILIQEMLIDMEVLYKKNQLGLCNRKLHKLKSIIEESLLYAYYPIISEWESKIAILLPYSKDMMIKLKESHEFAGAGLHNNNLLNQLRQIALDINLATTSDAYIRATQGKNIFHSLINHPLLILPPQGKNIFALARYYHIMHKLHEYNADFKKSLVFSVKCMDLIETHKAQFEDHMVFKVIPALSNILSSCIPLNQKRLFDKYIEMLNQYALQSKDHLVQNICDRFRISLQLKFNTINGHFDKAKEFISAAESKINPQKAKANSIQSHFFEDAYYIAYAHFGNQNYKLSDHWIDNILNHKKSGIREDIQSLAQLLHLMNHVEMGNIEYVNNKLRTTYNSLKRNKKLFKFEMLLLELLKKLINRSVNDNIFELLKKYSIAFDALNEDPYEKIILLNLDIASYLKSKFTDKNFQQIAVENRLRDTVEIDL